MTPTKPIDFFWDSEFELGLAEYESSSITTPNGHAKKVQKGGLLPVSGKMRFSLFRLAVALAKTVLTRDPVDEDLIKEVRAALYMLDSLLDMTVVDLRLAHRFRHKFRDFSKSSRMGELAQAASFVFAQEVLGHPLVLDFHGYLQSQKIPEVSPKVRTPDFALLFHSGSHRPTLLESKGTSPLGKTEAVKSDLKDGLDQCYAGESHIIAHAKPFYRAKSSFGTVLVAAEIKDAWPSFFAFCDPEKDDDKGMQDPIGAARQYYSAFLLLAGQRKLSRALFNSTLRRGQMEQSSQVEQIADVPYFVFNMHRTYNLFTPLLAKKKGVPPRRLPDQWLVRVDIIQAIVDNNSTAFTSIMEELSKELSSIEVQRDTMIFRDGTRCRRGFNPDGPLLSVGLT